MVNLETKYLGLTLKNPLIISASPISEKVERVLEYQEAGVAAVTVYSLFEEQITQDSLAADFFLDYGSESYAEATNYFPDYGRYSIGPETYLDHLREMKDAVDIPVIASLNGVNKGKWIEYAERIESTGVDALELNLYQVPADPDVDAKTLEASYLDLVRNIRMAVSIPLALKLSPFFTSFPNIARHFVEAGVNGLVLFNRFYQPDIDLDNFEVVPNLQLSHVSEMRLPLRWTAMLYGRINADFAMTSGIGSGQDVIKAVMAGANVAAVASEFLRHGASRASEMLSEMTEWMEENEYESIETMRGAMSQKSMNQSSAFERANYMKVLSSFRL